VNVVVVLDGAVDMSATIVVDAVGRGRRERHERWSSTLIDNGGPHVHGDVKGLGHVDVSALLHRRRSLAARERLGHVGDHVGDERHRGDAAGQVAR
jgi:hypothetical protein